MADCRTKRTLSYLDDDSPTEGPSEAGPGRRCLPAVEETGSGSVARSLQGGHVPQRGRPAPGRPAPAGRITNGYG